MKKIFLTTAIFIAISNFCFSRVENETVKANSEYEKSTINMLEAAANGDFEKARIDFDSTMLKALSAQQFQLFWMQLQLQYGKFISVSDFSESQKLENNIFIFSKIIFEHASIKLRTVTTQNKETNKIEIIGFFIDEVIKTENTEYVDAEYVDKSKFEEIAIDLPFEVILYSKLTIPIGLSENQKVPCVVLVHGSGPSDFDLTIFNNKPFRDIAYGLSSNGIAVLRYNKRTFVDENIDVENLTINEETVFDAVEAVKFLKKNYSAQIGKIYVLGISLGGYALPRIANLLDCKHIENCADGFISLAGSVRGLGDLLVEQFEYLYGLNKQDAETQEAKNYIDSLKNIEIAKAKRLQKNDFDKNTPSDSLPLGMPARYLLDLADYNPAKEFAKETRPILFLQGKRDYQVTVKDFDLWKKELGKKPNCTFILFDDLNHIMQAGTGKSKPSEYSEKKNVDKQVIDAIVKWIQR